MAGWVGSVLRWAGGSGESGKLSGAAEDEPTRKAIAYGSAIDSVGQTVNQKTTLGLPAAWACISLKSELVGSMGCGVYSKSDSGGRRSESGHWLYDLLHEEPNRDQTPAEFWAGQVAAMDLHGNAYAEKETLGGKVMALTPLEPHLVDVRRNRNNERVYLYADRGKVEELPADKVFHLKGITLGGDVGLSAIEYGRRTLGGAMAANKVAADALEHLKVDAGGEDALVMGMVAAATGHVEEWTQRAIGARLLEARFDAFEANRCIRLPGTPVAEIVSFRWRGADGQWHEGNLADIELDGRDIVPISEAPWTGFSLTPGSLRIVFRAGYPNDETGDQPRSTVPDQIRSAILLMTSFLYHNRGAETAQPPAAVAILLQPFRVYA